MASEKVEVKDELALDIERGMELLKNFDFAAATGQSIIYGDPNYVYYITTEGTESGTFARLTSLGWKEKPPHDKATGVGYENTRGVKIWRLPKKVQKAQLEAEAEYWRKKRGAPLSKQR